MQKQKNFQLAVIGVLAFAVIFMSVGFAAYSSTLNINGTATVKPNKWSVHFDEDSYQLAENSVDEDSIDVTDTTITYAATLEKPGDKFAFDIDVINDGTFDATLTNVTLSPLTEAQKKYLTYTLTYDASNEFSESSEVNIGLPHNTGSNKKNVMVVVTYVAPEDASDLPQSEVSVSLTASLNYVQAE